MNPPLKSADVQPAASGDGKSSEAAAPRHVLPPLPYGLAALEPCIDARTMTLHHDKHHGSYVEKLNVALAPYAELRRRSAAWLLVNGDSVPELVRTAVQNNAGGHLNHTFFWHSMSPAGGAGPSGPLAVAIDRAFGSFGTFKTHFVEAGGKVFGSGWVWLIASDKKRTGGPTLEIVTTAGHENPIQHGKQPLLVNDVWEHAYYLKYENRRADYLTNWWPIVDWKEVARRFENPDAPNLLESADGFIAESAK